MLSKQNGTEKLQVPSINVMKTFFSLDADWTPVVDPGGAAGLWAWVRVANPGQTAHL